MVAFVWKFIDKRVKQKTRFEYKLQSLVRLWFGYWVIVRISSRTSVPPKKFEYLELLVLVSRFVSVAVASCTTALWAVVYVAQYKNLLLLLWLNSKKMYFFQAMKRKINKNTCMLVGSAPCFNAGVIDPIEDIAKVRRLHNIVQWNPFNTESVGLM